MIHSSFGVAVLCKQPPALGRSNRGSGMIARPLMLVHASLEFPCPCCQTSNQGSGPPLLVKSRPVDLTEVEPQNIRHASHRGISAGLRVIVREHEASAGGVDLAGGTNHFWLAFRPAEAPERMLVTIKDTYESWFAERSLQFFAPGQRHAVEWRGAKGPVVQFLLAPAFLLEVTVALRVNAEALSSLPWQEVALDEPLETLCRLLMREVVGDCHHGFGYFEGLGRALTCTLVARLAAIHATVEGDPRLERAVRFLDQRFAERVTMKAAARIAGLSPDHFVEVFRSAMGCTPHQYLVQCRLRHARQLIASEGHRQSLAAGFADQAQLTRHFHRAIEQALPLFLRGGRTVLARLAVKNG
jgi:AraC-like DNA-binding protein